MTGHETTDDKHKIDEAMRIMDVADMASRPVSHLSGGELARVLVARALAQAPRVLLADEPTAGLDPAHQLALFRQFRSMAAGGKCVVIALHDLSMAARFCDEIILLKEGRCHGQGAATDILTAENLGHTYDVDMRLGEIDGVPVVLPLDGL